LKERPVRVFDIFLSLAAISLGGCGSHLPAFVDEQTLPLQDLVWKIDCEFQDAVRYEIYEKKRVSQEIHAAS